MYKLDFKVERYGNFIVILHLKIVILRILYEIFCVLFIV